MSTTLYKITIEYMDGRTEIIHYGYGSAPKDGVLHLHEVEQTSHSRTLILANVRHYGVDRLR